MEDVTISKLLSRPCSDSSTSGKVHVISGVQPSSRAALMSYIKRVDAVTPVLGEQPNTRAKLMVPLGASSWELPRCCWSWEVESVAPIFMRVNSYVYPMNLIGFINLSLISHNRRSQIMAI